jgi:hypothetical protein
MNPATPAGAKSTMTERFANGGSDCVGAIAWRARAFRNDCTTSTNTLKSSATTAHDIRTFPARLPDDHGADKRNWIRTGFPFEHLLPSHVAWRLMDRATQERI